MRRIGLRLAYACGEGDENDRVRIKLSESDIHTRVQGCEACLQWRALDAGYTDRGLDGHVWRGGDHNYGCTVACLGLCRLTGD